MSKKAPDKVQLLLRDLQVMFTFGNPYVYASAEGRRLSELKLFRKLHEFSGKDTTVIDRQIAELSVVENHRFDCARRWLHHVETVIAERCPTIQHLDPIPELIIQEAERRLSEEFRAEGKSLASVKPNDDRPCRFFDRASRGLKSSPHERF